MNNLILGKLSVIFLVIALAGCQIGDRNFVSPNEYSDIKKCWQIGASSNIIEGWLVLYSSSENSVSLDFVSKKCTLIVSEETIDPRFFVGYNENYISGGESLSEGKTISSNYVYPMLSLGRAVGVYEFVAEIEEDEGAEFNFSKVHFDSIRQMDIDPPLFVTSCQVEAKFCP